MKNADDLMFRDCSNNWLLDRPQLELARKEDLRYATRLECDALGVFFGNCKWLTTPTQALCPHSVSDDLLSRQTLAPCTLRQQQPQYYPQSPNASTSVKE